MNKIWKALLWWMLYLGSSLVIPDSGKAFNYVQDDSFLNWLEQSILKREKNKCRTDVCKIIQEWRFTFIKGRVVEITIDECFEKKYMTLFCQNPGYTEWIMSIFLAWGIDNIDFKKVRKAVKKKISSIHVYSLNSKILWKSSYLEDFIKLENENSK